MVWSPGTYVRQSATVTEGSDAGWTSTIASGATVHITFLPPVSRRSADADPDNPAPVGAQDQQATVHVPSIARPAAPAVDYVVPTMGLGRNPDRHANPIVVTRTGKGLRVYLDRPWFSTGDGELLGVMFW